MINFLDLVESVDDTRSFFLGNSVVHIAVGRLIKSAAYNLLPDCRFALDNQIGLQILETGLVQRTNLQWLMQHRSRKPICILNINGAKEIGDGYARYCAALGHGSTEIVGREVPETLWKQFLVYGVPAVVEERVRARAAGPTKPVDDVGKMLN